MQITPKISYRLPTNPVTREPFQLCYFCWVLPNNPIPQLWHGNFTAPMRRSQSNESVQSVKWVLLPALEKA